MCHYDKSLEIKSFILASIVLGSMSGLLEQYDVVGLIKGLLFKFLVSDIVKRFRIVSYIDEEVYGELSAYNLSRLLGVECTSNFYECINNCNIRTVLTDIEYKDAVFMHVNHHRTCDGLIEYGEYDTVFNKTF